MIGSRARWARRLEASKPNSACGGLASRTTTARKPFLDRQLADLAHPRTLAMLLIDALAGLPKLATWAQWLAISAR